MKYNPKTNTRYRKQEKIRNRTVKPTSGTGSKKKYETEPQNHHAVKEVRKKKKYLIDPYAL